MKISKLCLAGMIRDKKKKTGFGVAGVIIAVLELLPCPFFSIIIGGLAFWKIDYPVNEYVPTEPTTFIIEKL